MSNRISNRQVIEKGANKVIEMGNPNEEKKAPITTLIKHPRYHRAHRFAFSFSFSGKQPILEVSSKFGRYGTLVKYKGSYPEYKALVFSYPKALLIWIKHPKGVKTVEQLIEARKLAQGCAEQLARKHGLTQLTAKRTGYSEHTVENKRLDKTLRPLAEKEPDLMRERCGITENKTSHRGKLEHTDRDKVPGQFKAKDGVMALEEILYGKTATKEDIRELAEGIKEIVSSTKELNATIKELILGSIRPPEKPDRGAYV